VTHASVPIGRPIAGVQAVILDRDGNPAPLGVAGQLFVGGANLARGYADKPAATAERFVPHPFAGAPGERLYATGDLARSTLDGAIEFLGRVDHQVKVRGFRIEPAEIEAALERLPGVKRAVVVTREDRAGERIIVAYVVPAAPGRLDQAALIAFAADQLPKYLIPSSFVLIEAIPLTATGKVDRQALAAIAPAASPPAASVGPRTPTEQAIAGMWSAVLAVDRVGVFDDFFALGGESLRAMRILAQIRRAFDLELPIDSLVQGQATVATLAHDVDAALWLRATQEMPIGADSDELVI
jgi:acyl carrier protein